MRMNERRTALVFRRCCWYDLFGGRDVDVVVVGGFTLTEHKPMCVCVPIHDPTPFDV